MTKKWPNEMATTGTNIFFQLKVRLNIHISLTGMSHQMVFIFCAHILRSHFYARILKLKVRLNIHIS